jgi:hypothetical protein
MRGSKRRLLRLRRSTLLRSRSGLSHSASHAEKLGRHPDALAAAYLLAIKRRPKEIMKAVAR